MDWEGAKKDYDAGLTDYEIAEKYKVKQNTVKVHRNRSRWGPANKAKRKVKKTRNSSKRNAKYVTSHDDVTVTDTKNVTVTKPIASADGLNERQRLFCLYYYQLGNGARAYLKAYDCDYSFARVNASQLLTKPNVKRYIDDLKRRFASKQIKTTQDMLDTLVNQATSDISDYLDFKTIEVPATDEAGNPISDADGNPITYRQSSIWLKDKSKMDLSLVNELHKGKDGIVVKLYDKQKAIFKLLDMLPEPVEQNTKQNTFLDALKLSKKVFTENEQSDENTDKSDGHSQDTDK